MRLTNVFGGRPAPVDRNPSNVANVAYGVNGVGPHALTQRATYTVPVARKALCEAYGADVFCSTAPTTPGKVTAEVNATAGTYDETLSHRSVAVGDRSHLTKGSFGTLLAGQQIVINTSDSATGGNNDYLIDVKLLEFDA